VFKARVRRVCLVWGSVDRQDPCNSSSREEGNSLSMPTGLPATREQRAARSSRTIESKRRFSRSRTNDLEGKVHDRAQVGVVHGLRMKR